MKKYDNELFILFKKNPIDFYDSCIGIDELARVLGRSRRNTLRSLQNYLKKNNTYLLSKDNEKLLLLDKFILERGK